MTGPRPALRVRARSEGTLAGMRRRCRPSRQPTYRCHPSWPALPALKTAHVPLLLECVAGAHGKTPGTAREGGRAGAGAAGRQAETAQAAEGAGMSKD